MTFLNYCRRAGCGISVRTLLYGALILFICATQGASQNATANSVDPKDLIQFLSKTVAWYRQLVVERQIATEPSDLTFFDENQRVSSQVVQLAFDFARQQELALRKQPNTASAQAGKNVPEGSQGLAQMADKADAQVQQLQGEIDALHKKIAAATPKNARTLQPQLSETQSELGLFQARRDVLRSMMEFANGASANGLGASGLRAQIEELARSVPSALNQSTAQPAANSQQQSSAPASQHEAANGIWGLISNLFDLSHKIRTLDAEISATESLSQSAKHLRTPLVTNLKALIQSGDQLAIQADNSDPKQLAEQKKQLDQLTAQFKQASEAMLPLGKQSILLNLYQRSSTNWRDSIREEYHDQLRSLTVRVVILLVVIGMVIVIGEIWRKTILRYVHDTRRRYQFLLLRKIILWISIAIIIALAFATELTSVATFAGLLTAGVAVALQNVILSVVGYFFLIGKYGIRVGDRVQIAGVTGEVVDIGLVRMHLLELGAGGTDSQPSGRVVAFSNSIVFQPTSGLFKQIAGANFTWHEITLMFVPNSEYHVIKQRVVKAVNTAFSKYQKDIEEQQRRMEASVNSMATIELRPRTRVHYTAAGIEATVRFPVEPAKASEIDDQIMRELMTEVNQEPRLRMLGSATPTIKTEATADKE